MPCFLTVSSNRVLFRRATAMGELSTRASVMLAAAPGNICTLAPFVKRTKRPFPGTLKRGFKSAPVEELLFINFSEELLSCTMKFDEDNAINLMNKPS